MSVPATQIITPQTATQLLIPAPKVMLMGTSGSGKTHAIRSLVNAGFETFVLSTEPGIEKILGDIPPTKLHWHYLPPTAFTWDVLSRHAEMFMTMSYEQMSALKVTRNEFRQMLDLTNLLKNFKDQRTGKEFGDVAKWDNTRAFVIDGMSGLVMMGVKAWVGTRPVLSPGDYNVIQKMLEDLLNSLCMNLTCAFVLTCHVERELEEITGNVNVMVSAIGKKLAPKMPRFFDEVLLTKRDGTQFFWSNADKGVELKKRLLPFGDKLSPDFGAIASEWKRKVMN